jgi:hypothetical protein
VVVGGAVDHVGEGGVPRDLATRVHGVQALERVGRAGDVTVAPEFLYFYFYKLLFLIYK